MKKALFGILLIIPLFVNAQDVQGVYFQDVAVVPSDYEAAAKSFNLERKETLHILRTYIESKEALLGEVDKKIQIIENDIYTNLIDTTAGRRYLSAIDTLDPQQETGENIKHYLSNLGYMPQFYGTRKVFELDVITEKVRKKVTDIKRDYSILSILRASKKNLEDDINRAQLNIDDLYSKLYDDGKFKLWITGIFSFIVASLLLTFFVFISRKSETNLAKDFLSSGNGLQFITLFSLVIAIILFGVLGILEGRELAAILSGISGYILGKGIQNPRDLNKSNKQNNEAELATAEKIEA